VGGPQSFSDKFFGAFGRFDPEEGVTVMEPAAAGPGNWVGCPSVLYDPVRESILLTYRRRRPRGEPDDRGYECGIAESRDGVRFTELWRVRKQELGSASMERFNLHRDRDGHARARTVLTPAGTGTDAVKDPRRARGAGVPHVRQHLPHRPRARADVPGGERRRPRLPLAGRDAAVGTGWDRYHARLSCILRSGQRAAAEPLPGLSGGISPFPAQMAPAPRRRQSVRRSQS
jgi:hypothetical protein